MVSSRTFATGYDVTVKAAPGSAKAGQPPAVMQLCMGGVRMHRLDVAGVARQVRAALLRPAPRPLAIGSVNLDHVFHFGSRQGAAVSPSASIRWLMLIDGAPVAKRASSRTRQPWPRLTGADLLPDLLTLADRTGARVGFLGGRESTSRRLLDAVATRWPDLAVAGVWTPERDVVDDADSSARLAREIAAADVDLLVVGLGKPRQERWIASHGEATGARVLTAFGAAASFLAGTERRAPVWMRRAGVEWLYRLAAEPRRLWRRYLVQGPVAMTTMLRAPVSIDYVALPGGPPPT